VGKAIKGVGKAVAWLARMGHEKQGCNMTGKGGA